MPLQLKIEESLWKQPMKILHLSGRLDMQTSDPLTSLLKEPQSLAAKAWAVDLRHLEYISSAGVAVLLGLHHRLGKEQGKVCFINAQMPVARVFNLLGLDKNLAFFADEASARQSF